MLTPGDIPGVQITPLMTVGDTLSSGYRFESIPDGISLRRGPQPRRTSSSTTRPASCRSRGARPGATPRPTRENDFDNSQLSRLTLNQRDGRGARRLVRHRQQLRLPALLLELSGHLGGGLQPRHPLHQRGVARLLLPAGGLLAGRRSATRTRRRPAWSSPRPRRTASSTTIHGMGRHNHENSVPLPGYGKPVVLSGDDTFTSGPLTGAGVDAGRPCAVAALLVHREEHERRAEGQGRPVGVRVGHAGRRRLLRRAARARRCRSQATSSRSRGTSRPA